MKPINKISGNVCSVCRTIISSEPGDNLMCPKCQEKAIELLQQIISDFAAYQNETGIGMLDDTQWIDLFIERMSANITDCEEFLNNLEDE